MSNAFVGNRKAGFKSAHVIGAVAGVLTGAANYAQGSTLAGSAAGALVGGAVGYAVGDVFGVTDEFGTTMRILNGAASSMAGMAFSGMATGLVDALVNPKEAE